MPVKGEVESENGRKYQAQQKQRRGLIGPRECHIDTCLGRRHG